MSSSNHPTNQPPKINLGDRVAFSVGFLKSIGAITGPVPQMRGTVTRVVADDGNWRLLEVDWGGSSTQVNDKNLTLVSHIGIDSALNT